MFPFHVTALSISFKPRPVDYHYWLNISYFVKVITRPPYEVTETGWGEFEVIIKVYFNDPNEKPVSYLSFAIKIIT